MVIKVAKRVFKDSLLSAKQFETVLNSMGKAMSIEIDVVDAVNVLIPRLPRQTSAPLVDEDNIVRSPRNILVDDSELDGNYVWNGDAVNTSKSTMGDKETIVRLMKQAGFPESDITRMLSKIFGESNQLQKEPVTLTGKRKIEI